MAVKIISVLLILSIAVPFGIYFLGKKTRKRGKAMLITNISTFFSTLLVSMGMMFSGSVFAEESAAATTSVGAGMGYLAAALVTGLSSIGAGIAVAAASSTALGAISEDPKLMGKSPPFRCAGRRYRALWPAGFLHDSLQAVKPAYYRRRMWLQ